MVEPPRYPLTADLAGVLATARQERAGEFGRPLASLWRLVRRPSRPWTPPPWSAKRRRSF